MISIILATHGNFSEGILQSASMIFGEQEDVRAVVLDPNEGPEQLKEKLINAVNSLNEQKQVIFLVDLWGGTPFNQANSLLNEHPDTWAIVSGLNLPMLIDAFSLRSELNSAQELATKIIDSAIQGVKIKPESLSATKTTARKKATTKSAAIGNGQLQIALARVDSRLLHGQVATTWAKTSGTNRIIVVSDNVAKDSLRKKLIEQAAPPGVKANVIPIDKLIQISKDPRFGNTKALLLFETPQDALRVIDAGVDIKELNIGSMAHSVGKVLANKVLSMNQADIKTFKLLSKKGISFDVRKVPGDSKENMDDLLKKAQHELDKQH